MLPQSAARAVTTLPGPIVPSDARRSQAYNGARRASRRAPRGQGDVAGGVLDVEHRAGAEAVVDLGPPAAGLGREGISAGGERAGGNDGAVGGDLAAELVAGRVGQVGQVDRGRDAR